jgi:hypothetical protein
MELLWRRRVVGLAFGLTPVSEASPGVSMTTLAGLTALYTALGGGAWYSAANWFVGAPCDGPWHGLTCAGSALTGIDLNANGLHGTIPTQVGLLTDLRYALDLYGNSIVGVVPTQLGMLHQLWSVDVHRNQLSGTLPTQLGALARLSTFLYAHENGRLSGTLPSQLGELTRLRSLHVHTTALSGTLSSVALPASLVGIGLASNRSAEPPARTSAALSCALLVRPCPV